VLVTVLGFATLVLGAQAMSNPAASSPVLDVSVAAGIANCAAGTYPAVTITNTSGQTVAWSASANDPDIMLLPAGGSLGPGASTMVTVSGKTTATFFSIVFTAQGTQSVAKFACGAGKA
jgi:hypothetical protein